MEVMAPGSDHPLRAAMETRDLALLAEHLHPDVVLHSPVLSVPFEGREKVLELYDVLFAVLGEVTYREDVPDDPRVLVWQTHMGGVPLDGVDLVTYDDAGQVTEITVHLRPLTGIAAFLDATGPALAARRSRSRAVLVRLAGRPPSAAMRLMATTAPRLLGLRRRGSIKRGSGPGARSPRPGPSSIGQRWCRQPDGGRPKGSVG
jgi:hypothetical protein